MKKIIAVLVLASSFSCNGQMKLDDTSLKIDISKASTVCECNDIVIAIMKEQIVILNEVKRVGKKDKSMDYLDAEYKKRLDKHFEYYKHCQPIHQKEHDTGEKCANFKEGEKLDAQLSQLQKELGMN